MSSEVAIYGLIWLLTSAGIRADAQCQGGESLRGFYSAADLEDGEVTAKCCEQDGDCHGGFTIPVTRISTWNLSSSFENIYFELDHRRSKRSTETCAAGCVPDQIRACPSEASVFFPVSAISALSNERVTVLQAPPIVFQSVSFQKCSSDESLLFDAHCQQVFSVEVLYVIHVARNSSYAVDVVREPVLVESGCNCVFKTVVDENPGDDDAVSAVLQFLRN